jgi:hypothetical protein
LIDSTGRHYETAVEKHTGEGGHVIYMPANKSCNFDVNSTLTKEEQKQISDSMTSLTIQIFPSHAHRKEKFK